MIVEFDGVLADVMPAQFTAHRAAAQAVGWSRLDEATFRRLTRTKGGEADILPGAKAAKVAAYQTEFERLAESDEAVLGFEPQPDIVEFVRLLRRFGSVVLVTARSNVDARRRWVERFDWIGPVPSLEKLDDNPRRRPVELKVLAEKDDRAIVVASSDILVRSADAAELFVVGVSCGDRSIKRLTQAGARIVYKAPDQLTDSLQTGAADLVSAGMMPLTVG